MIQGKRSREEIQRTHLPSQEYDTQCLIPGHQPLSRSVIPALSEGPGVRQTGVWKPVMSLFWSE